MEMPWKIGVAKITIGGVKVAICDADQK